MPPPHSYSGSAACLCAELCDLVYKKPDEIRQGAAILLSQADVLIGSWSVADVQALAIAGQREIYIVFRGTVPSSSRSVLVNMRTRRARWGNGLVHSGYLGIVQRAIPFVSRAMRDFQDGSKSLYFAGHSQGGAVAYLAAMTFTLRVGLPTPEAVYTFGQPRAGNAAFSRDAEQRLLSRLSRIVHRGDPVVGLPPVFLGYDHTRDYLHYGDDGAVSRRKQAARQGWKSPPYRKRCHEMTRYLACGRQNASKPPV